MKALTVWQPWTSLIIVGAKPYEFRGWRPPPSLIGQRIVIHAAARNIDVDEARELHRVLAYRHSSEDLAHRAAQTCLFAAEAIPILERAWFPKADALPMAAGIGTAILGEPRPGKDIAAEFGIPRANDSDRDEHANWGWPMLDIEPWETPIPMRGKQGFWNWPEPNDFGELA